MEYYNSDIKPKGNLKIVLTVDGTKEYSKNCYRDSNTDTYYRIGDQCYIDEEGNRIIKGNEVLDCETGKIVDKTTTKNLINGVVSFNGKEPVLGYFTQNRLNNIRIHDSKNNFTQTAINEDILPEDTYFESFYDEAFLLKSYFTQKQIEERTNKKFVMSKYKNQPHEIEENTKLYPMTIDSFKKTIFSEDEKCERLSHFLKGYMWGIEEEFSSGYISDRFLLRYGWVMCRDGSTSSETEAVSIPYKGLKGLIATKNSFQYFNKNLLVDDSCSLHIHVSGWPKTKEFIVAMWKIGQAIQEELFLLFNHCKQDYTLKKKNNNKNYNKFLDNILKDFNPKNDYGKFIDYAYNEIFEYLSEDGNKNRMKASKDTDYITGVQHQVAHKWQRPNRYLWLNFSNIFFSNRGTIEFRPATPTTNPIKVVSWLFICIAILDYAKKYTKEIISEDKVITLSMIVSIFEENNQENVEATWLSSYLKSYIKSRKNEQFTYIKQNDYNGDSELNTDSSFNFIHLGETIA